MLIIYSFDLCGIMLVLVLVLTLFYLYYLDEPSITVHRDGHGVSRTSDFILYSVEAEFIDNVVAQYGPCAYHLLLLFVYYDFHLPTSTPLFHPFLLSSCPYNSNPEREKHPVSDIQSWLSSANRSITPKL